MGTVTPNAATNTIESFRRTQTVFGWHAMMLWFMKAPDVPQQLQAGSTRLLTGDYLISEHCRKIASAEPTIEYSMSEAPIHGLPRHSVAEIEKTFGAEPMISPTLCCRQHDPLAGASDALPGDRRRT
jgi:hypothetical protein